MPDAHHSMQRRDLMAESTCHAGGKLQARTWRNSVDRYTRFAAPAEHRPAQTARTHGSGLTAKRHNMVLATRFAEKVCEAPRQDATVHEPVQLAGHELGQRAPAGLVGPLLLEGQQMLLHHTAKRSLLGLPARIHRSRRRGLCACRCLHKGDLSANGSRKLRGGSEHSASASHDSFSSRRCPCAGGILPYDFTAKVTVCVFTFVPEVAVSVIAAVPAAAAALAANFTVVLPFPGAARVAGVNAAVTPVGNP